MKISLQEIRDTVRDKFDSMEPLPEGFRKGTERHCFIHEAASALEKAQGTDDLCPELTVVYAAVCLLRDMSDSSALIDIVSICLDRSVLTYPQVFQEGDVPLYSRVERAREKRHHILENRKYF